MSALAAPVVYIGFILRRCVVVVEPLLFAKAEPVDQLALRLAVRHCS
jgi:hypothetical protein